MWRWETRAPEKATFRTAAKTSARELILQEYDDAKAFMLLLDQ